VQHVLTNSTLQQVLQQLSYFTAGCALDDDDDGDDYEEFIWSPAEHNPQT